jgi:hypothetical protein
MTNEEREKTIKGAIAIAKIIKVLIILIIPTFLFYLGACICCVLSRQ